ncbi:hypothetical protein BD289DRAFT_148444 [Coniella lustricola]|uniref:Uncharacterized protein n=1 Tax=Coniella lustricola TaxID=2025994 RepID=A0A2T2ZUV7_9PEZI|nr:hypothetical protein BD289DRAFT_148444 [Coniella lustricola]
MGLQSGKKNKKIIKKEKERKKKRNTRSQIRSCERLRLLSSFFLSLFLSASSFFLLFLFFFFCFFFFFFFFFTIITTIISLTLDSMQMPTSFPLFFSREGGEIPRLFVLFLLLPFHNPHTTPQQYPDDVEFVFPSCGGRGGPFHHRHQPWLHWAGISERCLAFPRVLSLFDCLIGLFFFWLWLLKSAYDLIRPVCVCVCARRVSRLLGSRSLDSSLRPCIYGWHLRKCRLPLDGRHVTRLSCGIAGREKKAAYASFTWALRSRYCAKDSLFCCASYRPVIATVCSIVRPMCSDKDDGMDD